MGRVSKDEVIFVVVLGALIALRLAGIVDLVRQDSL